MRTAKELRAAYLQSIGRPRKSRLSKGKFSPDLIQDYNRYVTELKDKKLISYQLYYRGLM